MFREYKAYLVLKIPIRAFIVSLGIISSPKKTNKK